MFMMAFPLLWIKVCYTYVPPFSPTCPRLAAGYHYFDTYLLLSNASELQIDTPLDRKLHVPRMNEL